MDVGAPMAYWRGLCGRLSSRGFSGVAGPRESRGSVVPKGRQDETEERSSFRECDSEGGDEENWKR